MEEDVIVADENFRFASYIIKNYGSFLYLHLDVYEWILRQVNECAIQDDAITCVLNEILEGMAGVKEGIREAVCQIWECSISFVEDIDEADQFLYGE